MKRAGTLLLLVGWMALGAGCGTPPKVARTDPEIERNVALARGAFTAGSAEKAAVYYHKALDRARLMDNSELIGRNAYNLAACLTMLQRYDEAGAFLDEAEMEFRRVGIKASEIPLLKARIAQREGQTDAALDLVQTQLRTVPVKDPYLLQYQILLANLLCAKGDAAGAAQEIGRVNRSSLNAADPATQAEAAQVRGRLALMQYKPHEAGGFFDAAAGYFQQAGQYITMAMALDQAGRAYEAAGDPGAAMDRYYRSARSLLFAGQNEQVARVMIRAAQLADQSGNAEMQKKLKRLQADMNSSNTVAASDP